MSIKNLVVDTNVGESEADFISNSYINSCWNVPCLLIVFVFVRIVTNVGTDRCYDTYAVPRDAVSSEKFRVRPGRVWLVCVVLRKPVGSFINFKILKYLCD